MSDPNAPIPGDGTTPPPPPAAPGAGQPPQYQAPQPPQQPQQPYTPPQQPYAQAPQQPYAGAPAQPYSPDSDRQLAMWAHIGGVVGLLPSLIIWLIGKDRGPRTNVEGKEALNWQITWIIAYVALWILNTIFTFVFWPLALIFSFAMLAVWVVNVIFSIIGGVKVNNGGSYRYPVNFRFIK